MGQFHRFGRSEILQHLCDSSAIPLTAIGRPRRLRRTAPWHFVATPAVIGEGWLVARHLDASTKAGDVVITDDQDAQAGLFALQQAMLPTDARRHVVVVAGESRTLERLWVGGTLDGEPADDPVIDWELVLYRFAERVVTPSALAAELLQSAGIRADVEMVAIAQAPRSVSAGTRRVASVWLPERQSRRAQTARILRALVGSDPSIALHVSNATEPDHVWSGTTTEANANLLDMLGARVAGDTRPPDTPDLVVLGDPFRLPEAEVVAVRDGGVPVITAWGSTAASLWPESPSWSSEDELAEAIRGEGQPTAGARALRPADALSAAAPAADQLRARRVSVAVPVFRDVRFLDECLESIVTQTQPPVEVILVDDGSQSSEVDAAFDRWADLHSGLIRVIRQHNRGVSAARNAALGVMTGDAFVLVDADDILAPTFIESTANALRGAPDLWAVATWTEFFGDYEGVEAKPPFDERVGRRENPIVSTCVLVDMKVRDRGIRFDPELAFIYCEDWDFWSQIVADGGRFGLVPEPLVRHRVHGSSGASVRTALAHRIGKSRASARLDGTPRIGVVRRPGGR